MVRKKRLSTAAKGAKKKDRNKLRSTAIGQTTADNESIDDSSIKGVRKLPTRRISTAAKANKRRKQYIRQNPSVKAEKQKRERRKYTSDVEFRARRKKQMRSYNKILEKRMQQKYADDIEFRGALKNRMRERMHARYGADIEFRGALKTRMRRKYADDIEFRDKLKNRMRERMSTRYGTDVDFRTKCRLSQKLRDRYGKDQSFRRAWCNRMRLKYLNDAAFQIYWLNRMKIQFKRQYNVSERFQQLNRRKAKHLMSRHRKQQ